MSISRSGFYCEPVPESQENLTLMRRLDELHLEYPVYGSRRLTAVLPREGRLVNPISGGSLATPSVVPAVLAAADNAMRSLLNIPRSTPGSPFQNRKRDELTFENGKIFVKADGPGSGIPFADVLRRANLRLVSGNGKSEATFGNPKPKFSTHSFGCHFVEITWQPEIARLRVSRVVSVIDAGRILNPLAGRNQIEGAVVMGIGMALFEHTHYDPQTGAPINSNLADYVMTCSAPKLSSEWPMWLYQLIESRS